MHKSFVEGVESGLPISGAIFNNRIAETDLCFYPIDGHYWGMSL